MTVVKIVPNDGKEQRDMDALDKANQIIFSKIDANTGLKYVYVPLLLTDSAFKVLSLVRDLLAKSAKEDPKLFIENGQAEAVRKVTRDIRENRDYYEKSLKLQLCENRKALDIHSEDFFDELQKTYEGLMNYCAERLMEMYTFKGNNFVYLIASCFMINMLLDYKDEFEQKCLADMQKMLDGTTLKIHQNKTLWGKRLREHTNRILRIFEAPDKLDSDMIRLYQSILDDKISKMDFVLKAHELFDEKI